MKSIRPLGPRAAVGALALILLTLAAFSDPANPAGTALGQALLANKWSWARGDGKGHTWKTTLTFHEDGTITNPTDHHTWFWWVIDNKTVHVQFHREPGSPPTANLKAGMNLTFSEDLKYYLGIDVPDPGRPTASGERKEPKIAAVPAEPVGPNPAPSTPAPTPPAAPPPASPSLPPAPANSKIAPSAPAKPAPASLLGQTLVANKWSWARGDGKGHTWKTILTFHEDGTITNPTDHHTWYWWAMDNKTVHVQFHREPGSPPTANLKAGMDLTFSDDLKYYLGIDVPDPKRPTASGERKEPKIASVPAAPTPAQTSPPAGATPTPAPSIPKPLPAPTVPTSTPAQSSPKPPTAPASPAPTPPPPASPTPPPAPADSKIAPSAPAKPAPVHAEPIAFSQLPPAVQKAVQAIIGNGQVTSISKGAKDDEEGVVSYEVNFTRDGQPRDLRVGEDGRLLSIRMTFAEIPPAVQKAIQAKLGGNTLDAIEKTLDSDETTYVVEITTKDGRESQVTIADDGELLEEEIALSQAPAPVQKTVAAQIGNGTLTMLVKIFGEKITYDADFTKDGKDRAVTIASNGALLSVKISLAETTAAAQQTILEKVGNGRIVSVWKSFEKRENVLPFKVVSVKDGKPFDFSVSPKGRFLGLDE